MTEFDPKDMEFRLLGNSGLRVSVLSYGGWITEDPNVTKECFQEAWNQGINFFDTAEGYDNGECETVFGQIFKELGWTRSDYVVSTKLYFGFGGKSPNGTGLSRKHVIEGMNSSLKRLQMDYVDVVFAHRPDRGGVPMEEVVRAFTQLILDGKALYWGTSEWSAFEIEHAHHIATKFNLIAPIAEQPQYNALKRDRFEAEYKPLFDLYKYGSTVWSPLASGVLTGKYSNGFPEGTRLGDAKPGHPAAIKSKWVTPEGLAKIAKVKKLDPIAVKLGCTTGQLSLAFVIKNPNVTTVILGASKASQIAENVKALAVVKKLTPEVMEEIEAVLENKPNYSSMY